MIYIVAHIEASTLVRKKTPLLTSLQQYLNPYHKGKKPDGVATKHMNIGML